ncbi:MAG: sulfotransferase [Symploca sp. SIO3E6]|nr:sulfotransferase [Caldora sp. SIO3E6]
MSHPQLIIHIGFPKAASSWLQQVIFNDEKLGFFSPWGLESAEAIEQFVIPDSFHFSAESTFKVFEPGLQEAASRGMVPIISHECLVGNQMAGTYYGKEAADRIHNVFPEARILILLREQKSMVLSSYRQYIKSGGMKTIEDFMGATQRRPGFAPPCQLTYLEYDLLIAYYQKLFGVDNVLVLPFELLKEKQQFLCQKVLSFAGLDGTPEYQQESKNVGFRGLTMEFRRKLNSVVKRPDFGNVQGSRSLAWRIAEKLSKILDRFVPQSIHKQIEDPLKQSIAETIGDSFRKSNQKTSQLIGMNLADFGYDS